MQKNILSPILFLTIIMCTTYTQGRAATNAPSSEALQYVKVAVQNCPTHWDNPACLQTISQSVVTMAVNYGEDLKKQNKPKGADYLEQHCAAATAGAKDSSLPAYALKSAFTECANAVSEINKQLNIMPDASLYQLLVISITCLSEDKQQACSAIEQELIKNYK